MGLNCAAATTAAIYASHITSPRKENSKITQSRGEAMFGLADHSPVALSPVLQRQRHACFAAHNNKRTRSVLWSPPRLAGIPS